MAVHGRRACGPPHNSLRLVGGGHAIEAGAAYQPHYVSSFQIRNEN